VGRWRASWQPHDRKGLCGLGAILRSRLRRGFLPRPRGFDRGAERIGGRILDVGVGTGISLADYSRRNRVVGVDFSEPMLRKAQERVAREKLSTSRRWP